MAAFGTGGRKAGQGSNWIVKARRVAIYLRDDFTCCYCGRHLKNAPAAEIGLDHLVCSSKGGTNENTNLVTCCRSCNSSRCDRDLEDFAPGGALERIAVQRYAFVNLPLAKALLAGQTGDENS